MAKLGWQFYREVLSMPVDNTLRGFSCDPVDVLQTQAKEWEKQVMEDIEPGDPTHVLYYEMADWFDDNVTEEQDEEWKYPVCIKLAADGSYQIFASTGVWNISP